jgi:hypothetical protein
MYFNCFDYHNDSMPTPAVDWSERRRLLREIAVCGDPAGAAEEAPQSPRGKRSLSWKSTASSTTTLIYLKTTIFAITAKVKQSIHPSEVLA